MGNTQPANPQTTLTPLATLGLVEVYIYRRLLLESGAWSGWRPRFRLTCKAWSELELEEHHYQHAFLRRFPFYELCYGAELVDAARTWLPAYLDPDRPPRGQFERVRPVSWREFLLEVTKEAANTQRPAGKLLAEAQQGNALRRLWRGRTLSGIMTGLDAAGKTTIMNRLCPQQDHMYPCIGFQVAEYNLGNLRVSEWDCGGQDKVRPLWRHYYQGCETLIFVVDSVDHARLDQAAQQLHQFLNEPEFCSAGPFPVLVIGCKQDLPGALSPAQLWDRLRLDAFAPGVAPKGLGQYRLHVHVCNVLKKGDLEPAFEWLQRQLPDWNGVPL